MIADGVVQYGRCCSDEILADETEIEQIVLVQVPRNELEYIEVEVASGDHVLQSLVARDN